MCPQCKEIFDIWRKGNKALEDTSILSREVPQRFTYVHKYFDDKRQTMMYVLQCNQCEQAFHIPR